MDLQSPGAGNGSGASSRRASSQSQCGHRSTKSRTVNLRVLSRNSEVRQYEVNSFNFQRPHQGIDGLVPADRFFGAASEVRRTLEARVQANALELARQGVPKAPFYLTGQAGGQPFSVHAEGERVILQRAEGERQEVDLLPPTAVGPGKTAGVLPLPVCPLGEVSGLGTEGAGAE